jgi:hypothetical protein
MDAIQANGCGEAERLWGRYFARSPKLAAEEAAPKDIEGDRISYVARVRENREGDLPFPDYGYFLPAQRKGAKHVYIDICPQVRNLRLPVLYEIDGASDRKDPAAAREEPFKRLQDQRDQCVDDFDEVRKPKRLIAALKKWIATDENVRKALVANGTISKIKGIQKKELRDTLDPKHIVELEQVRDYLEGYHGALNPSPFKRALLNVAYRPVIMARAGLRTMCNPDEVGAKGTRTFWSNVPVGIAVSLLVAAVALIYLNRSSRKST